MIRIKNFKKGFTLIELLIVIAIIGVLATLLMANFIGVRQRARDAQRKSDLRQIQSAFEIYRSDLGTYPATAGLGSFPTASSCGTSLKSADSVTTYMARIPCDPSGTSYYNGGSYYHIYGSTGDSSTYKLVACLENTADSQGTTDAQGGAGCSSGTYFVVDNP